MDRETLDRIEEIAERHPLVERVKSITGRSSGSYKFIEMELVLKTDNFERAHEITHRIEEEVKKEVPFIERLLIHFEPPEEREKVIALMLDEGNKPCREPINCKRVNIYSSSKEGFKRVEILRIDKPLTSEKGSCASLFETLACKKVDCLFVGSNFFGKGALYTAAYFDIAIGELEAENLKEAENSLRSGKFNCTPASEILRFKC